ncbi:MAG: GNAT family protein [Fimbriimonadaceae bacterium]
MPVEVGPVILEGERLRLEPLEERHAEGLWKQAEPDLFRWMRLWWWHDSEQEFIDLIKEIRGRKDSFAFTMIDKETGAPVGSSSYLEIRPEHRSLEIGATWIGKSHQGTRVNPEAKLLMLGHAFDQLGAIRVQLKTDSRNIQSQRAMEKLGAKRDGVLRSHIICPDGSIRDSVYYSIIENEWPAVRKGLIERIGT